MAEDPDYDALASGEVCINSISWSQDGRRIALKRADGTISCWDIELSREPALLLAPGPAIGAVFGPDSRHILASFGDGSVRGWNLDDGTQTLTLEGPDDGGRLQLPPMPDNFSGGYKDLPAMDAMYGDLAASADRRRIAAVGTGGSSILIWDSASGERVASVPTKLAMSCALDGPGGRVLYTPLGVRVQIDEVATLGPLLSISADANCAAFSPDGRRIAGGRGSDLCVWDASSGQELLAMPLAPKERLMGIAFSPDGRRLSGGFVRSLSLWDAETGRPLWTVSSEGARTIAFAPDGRRIATTPPPVMGGGTSALVRLWDAETGNPLFDLHGHTGVIRGIDFSPDGRRLASASLDSSIRVWNVDAIERFIAAPADALIADAERRTGFRVEGIDVIPVPRDPGAPPPK
jgi:WD40 repeat protein